jgi:hypothetical protein
MGNQQGKVIKVGNHTVQVQKLVAEGILIHFHSQTIRYNTVQQTTVQQTTTKNKEQQTTSKYHNNK